MQQVSPYLGYCLAIAAAALLVSILNYVIFIVLRNHRAHQFFKQKSPNLQVLPKPSLFSGHSMSLFYNERNVHIIDELHKQYGSTFGWYHCDQPAVCTTDLELIKAFVLDDPDNHKNRKTFINSYAEIEDSILNAEGDDWVRLRKAIAPAFS